MKQNLRQNTVTFVLLGGLIVIASFASKTVVQHQPKSIETKNVEKPADYAWVELGPDGALARIVTSEAACPALRVDQDILPMVERGRRSQNFPVLVCEALIPNGARFASVGAHILPLPKEVPKRILVLGDSGCRIEEKKKEMHIQACNDGLAWPLSTIAHSAANWHADLIIHVGDYHYREEKCPADHAECAGSVSGDVWGSWQQDFFEPARELLQSAPFVLVRGNHELCSRAGRGWFQFLDPREMVEKCSDITDPYWINLGEHQLAVIDSADEGNIQPSLDKLLLPDEGLIWLTLHRPFLDRDGDVKVSATDLPPPIEKGKRLSLVLAGHKHILSLRQFKGEKPPELIVGNSGAQLDESGKGEKDDMKMEYFDFGFLTIERMEEGILQIVGHDRNSNPVIECTLWEGVGKLSKLQCHKVISGT